MVSNLDCLVVGAGMMGSITPGIIRQAGGEIVGVLGISRNEVDTFLASPGVHLPNVTMRGTVADDFATILANEAFDAVVLAVPNYLHADLACQAAQAKKHVLIEKPLATSTPDAKRVLSAVLENGIAAEINSQYRHHALLDGTVREIINSGKLGKPLYIDMKYLQDWQIDPAQDIGWRPVVAIAGKGKLIGDLGAHLLQATLHLYGGEFTEFDGKQLNVHPIRYKLKSGIAGTFGSSQVPSPTEKPELYDTIDMLNPQFSGDDIASANFILRTESGVLVPGSYQLSQVHAGHKNDMTMDLYFDKGRISWRQEEPNYLTVVDGSTTMRVERASSPSTSGRPPGHPHGYGDAILLEVEQFIGVIKRNDPDEISAYSTRNIGQGVQAVKIVEAWANSPLKQLR